MNARVVLAIIIAVVSVLAGASAQLDPIVGATAAKSIVAVCNLATAILGSIMGVLSTQTSQVQAVQSMPGVSRITVNAQASPALAQLAVQSGNPKVQPESDAAASKLKETAAAS